MRVHFVKKRYEKSLVRIFFQPGQPSGSIQVTPTLVAEETVPVIGQEEVGPPQQLQGNIFSLELQIEDTARKNLTRLKRAFE